MEASLIHFHNYQKLSDQSGGGYLLHKSHAARSKNVFTASISTVEWGSITAWDTPAHREPAASSPELQPRAQCHTPRQRLCSCRKASDPHISNRAAALLTATRKALCTGLPPGGQVFPVDASSLGYLYFKTNVFESFLPYFIKSKMYSGVKETLYFRQPWERYAGCQLNYDTPPTSLWRNVNM